jgi:hypothetical protein
MANTRTVNFTYELTPVAVAVKKITVSSTAGTLETLGSFTFAANTKIVRIAVESNPVRVDPSGNTPDASTGIPYAANALIDISVNEAKMGKWIRSGASDATFQVVQYTY